MKEDFLQFYEGHTPRENTEALKISAPMCKTMETPHEQSPIRLHVNRSSSIVFKLERRRIILFFFSFFFFGRLEMHLN